MLLGANGSRVNVTFLRHTDGFDAKTISVDFQRGITDVQQAQRVRVREGACGTHLSIVRVYA